jgi:hypothetical protein
MKLLIMKFSPLTLYLAVSNFYSYLLLSVYPSPPVSLLMLERLKVCCLRALFYDLLFMTYTKPDNIPTMQCEQQHFPFHISLQTPSMCSFAQIYTS